MRKSLPRTRVSPVPRAWQIAVGALAIAGLACSLLIPGSDQTGQGSGLEAASKIYEETGVSLDEALAVPVEDRRQEILDMFGAPDAFTLQWQELQGQVVRQEEWSYFDFKSRFDFVDGELVWVLDIPEAPDGSIYAHAFDPRAFQPGMSIEEAKALVGDPDLTELPLDEGDIPGGLLLAGDQILLGFDQGQLVCVQTFILTPEGALPSMSDLGPTAETAATAPAPASGERLVDAFNDPSKTAVPLFGPRYMDFQADAGTGTLSAHAPGVMVALYDAPQLTDFTVTVALLVPDPKPNAGYGLAFGAQETGGQLTDYCMVVVEPTSSLLHLWCHTEGSLRDVAQAPLPASQANVWEVTIRVSGSTITASANGGQQLVANDAPLLGPGRLGLVLLSRTSDDVALFHDFEAEADHE